MALIENPELRLSSYDYALPLQLIAQTPIEPRDAARLLVLDRARETLEHRHVRDLPEYLHPGDLLVANRTRVLPSRLRGTKVGSGGGVELLLLRPAPDGSWEALVKAHRLRAGQTVELPGGASAEIGPLEGGTRRVHFRGTGDVAAFLHTHGEVPLPPYIHGYNGDPERYQTTFAQVEGSAAAPTAGLHLTPELIASLQAKGVAWATVLLHVGLDTFRPIVEEDVRAHHIHTEWVEVGAEVVEAVRATRAQGGRVVAVGTTTVRAIEHASASGELRPYQGNADLFIVPGYQFRTVDALMTNFHLPKSSLLLLVSALAGRERILQAYAEAVRLQYRFFSFGDAMLIV